MNPYLTKPIERGEAQALLSRAGILDQIARVAPCSGGVTNLNYEVVLESGRRVLLRRYAATEGAADAAATEALLDPLLRAHAVPSPRLIAAPDEGDFAIFEWLDGIRLRDAANSEPDPSRLAGAWADVGTALRRTHDIGLPDRRNGDFRGGRLVKLDVPWADGFARDLRSAAATLRGMALLSDVDQQRIGAIADRAGTFVGGHIPSLLHGDAHAANVLVRDGRAERVLTGWIDWERAAVGDPELDLAVFDVFTRAQVGGTPEAFWTGYGRHPIVERYRFYELVIVLSLASIDHAQALPPGRDARRIVTTDLARLLDALSS
jgi:aminoglycoside phosphotransferase (APT) family kinase protein